MLDRCIDIQGFIESDIKKVGSRIQEKEIYGKEIIRKLPEDASIIEAGKYYKEIDKMICEAKADVDRYFLKDEFELGIYKENKIIVDAEKSIYWKRASLMNLGEFFLIESLCFMVMILMLPVSIVKYLKCWILQMF